MSGQFRIQFNEDLSYLYRSPIIITIVKYKMSKWGGHDGGNKKCMRYFGRLTPQIASLGRHRRKSVNNSGTHRHVSH